jgi:hypothetical protein
MPAPSQEKVDTAVAVMVIVKATKDSEAGILGSGAGIGQEPSTGRGSRKGSMHSSGLFRVSALGPADWEKWRRIGGDR